jgi:hypothetical protein
MFFQPRLDLGMLVRCTVIANPMERLVPERFPIDLAQEAEPFARAVTLRTAGDHLAIERTHGGNQGLVPWRL